LALSLEIPLQDGFLMQSSSLLSPKAQ